MRRADAEEDIATQEFAQFDSTCGGESLHACLFARLFVLFLNCLTTYLVGDGAGTIRRTRTVLVRFFIGHLWNSLRTAVLNATCKVRNR